MKALKWALAATLSFTTVHGHADTNSAQQRKSAILNQQVEVIRSLSDTELRASILELREALARTQEDLKAARPLNKPTREFAIKIREHMLTTVGAAGIALVLGVIADFALDFNRGHNVTSNIIISAATVAGVAMAVGGVAQSYIYLTNDEVTRTLSKIDEINVQLGELEARIGK